MHNTSSAPSPRMCHGFYSGCNREGIVSMIYPHRCTRSSNGTIVPDVVDVNEEGRRVGVIFGNAKRRSLLLALGLGGTSTEKENAASTRSEDTDHGAHDDQEPENTQVRNATLSPDVLPTSTLDARDSTDLTGLFDLVETVYSSPDPASNTPSTSAHATSSKSIVGGMNAAVDNSRGSRQRTSGYVDFDIGVKRRSITISTPVIGEGYAENESKAEQTSAKSVACVRYMKPLRLQGGSSKWSANESDLSKFGRVDRDLINTSTAEAQQTAQASRTPASQARSPRDTIADGFVLNGKIAVVCRSQGPRQDVSAKAVSKLKNSTRPRPESVFAQHPKSGENIRDYMFQCGAGAIVRPKLRPLRLQGTLGGVRSSVTRDDSESSMVESDSTETIKAHSTPVMPSLPVALPPSTSVNTLELFETVQAMYSNPMVAPNPASSGKDLITDAFVLGGKVVAVSRTGGSRQKARDNVGFDAGMSSLDSAHRSSSGEFDYRGTSGKVGVLSPPKPLRVNSKTRDCAEPAKMVYSQDASKLDVDEDEDEDDEDVVNSDPFEYDYLMDPVHPVQTRATTTAHDDNEEDDDLLEDPFKYNYVLDSTPVSPGFSIPALVIESTASSPDSTPPATPTCADTVLPSPNGLSIADKPLVISGCYDFVGREDRYEVGAFGATL